MDMDTDKMQQGEVGDLVEVNTQRIATGAEITTLATTVSSNDEILIIAGMEDWVIELATLNFNAKLTPFSPCSRQAPFLPHWHFWRIRRISLCLV